MSGDAPARLLEGVRTAHGQSAARAHGIFRSPGKTCPCLALTAPVVPACHPRL